MTLTQALPQGLDLTPDLEAWLRGEIEKPCEAREAWSSFGVIISTHDCDRPAKWLVYKQANCPHPQNKVTLMCGKHKGWAARGKVICGFARMTDTCPRPTVTYIERIRKRWWR